MCERLIICKTAAPRGCRCEWACKPSSVVNSHLSRSCVATRLKPPVEAHRANVSLLSALHRIGFTWPHSLLRAGELLPRLSTLTVKRRYISVALSLGSPPAAVSRYPALRCSDFPHARSARDCSAHLRRNSTTFFRQNQPFIPLEKCKISNNPFPARSTGSGDRVPAAVPRPDAVTRRHRRRHRAASRETMHRS